MKIINKDEDTICALATPPGQGGIGIIKISGPQSFSILKKIFLPYSKTNKKIKPRYLTYGFIVNPQTEEKIDEVLASYMPKPKTYTREDVVEISSHSNFLILEKILNLILTQGARLAEPGEFTRRAFLNGRIDLTQAEAVCQLVKAQNLAAFRQAQFHLEGQLSKLIKKLKNKLIEIISYLEVEIDFDDTEKRIIKKESLIKRIQAIKKEIETLIKVSYLEKIYQEGIKVVLIGLPNVGKSSLFNSLLKENKAIVTHLPGTTRDLIEESITLEGINIKLIDTAGLTNLLEDKIDQEAFKKSILAIKKADLSLIIFNVSRQNFWTNFFNRVKKSVIKEIKTKPHFLIGNKKDLINSQKEKEIQAKYPDLILVSAKKNQGIEKIKKMIRDFILNKERGLNYESVLVVNTRQKELLKKTLLALKKALINIKNNFQEELIIFDLKEALSFLSEITGEKFVTSEEEILDKIFKNFCVGK